MKHDALKPSAPAVQLTDAAQQTDDAQPASDLQPADDAQTLHSPQNARRQFLGQVGVATASVAIGAAGLGSVASAQNRFRATRTLPAEPLAGQDVPPLQDTGPLTGAARAERAFQLRVNAAQRERNLPIPEHPDNDDEELYGARRRYIGNFSKGLRHDPNTGEVDPVAYQALLNAISTGQFADFESLRQYQGCADPLRQRPFVNPESANGFDMEGTDPAQLMIEEANGTRRPFRPAPAFASAEEAGEMVELYWMSLLRDVPFDSYDTNPIAQAAATDLSNMSDFRGPKIGGRVTTQTLFRDNFPGCTTGPYISQFLIRGTSDNIPGVEDLPAGVQFGAQRIDLRIRNYAANTNYLADFASWLDVQNGCIPNLNVPFDNLGLTYIRDGRGIGQYVRLDVLYQAYFVAALILIDGITLNETTSPFVFRFPFDAGNPYGRDGATIVQAGFGQFGNPHLMTIVTEPSTRALKAVWYQKWRVHRRLRPEEFGGRVEAVRLERAKYPIHPDLTSRSTVLPQILNRFGSHLLSQAFPEGSPMHPAYGSGHATVAGACVTMLKAFFDEGTVIQEPRRVDPNDPSRLIPYEGPDLTVGGELNKIASNIAQGRNIAGVHWRTDASEAILLGEQVAISMLQDMAGTYGEPFGGFSLTKFNGQQITVGG